jgi:hypothetical protein
VLANLSKQRDSKAKQCGGLGELELEHGLGHFVRRMTIAA